MMRGTFGNIRLRNLMVPRVEGPWTRHVPSGETMSIYDAAVRYQREATPLIVIAGKGVWLAQVAGLGGQGFDIARRESNHRPDIRAH
jgi:hypothetical protein